MTCQKIEKSRENGEQSNKTELSRTALLFAYWSVLFSSVQFSHAALYRPTPQKPDL